MNRVSRYYSRIFTSIHDVPCAPPPPRTTAGLQKRKAQSANALVLTVCKPNFVGNDKNENQKATLYTDRQNLMLCVMPTPRGPAGGDWSVS